MISPASIHQRVLAGDRGAEEELVSFLHGLFGFEYRRSLGLLADDYLQELCLAVIEGIRRKTVEHPQFLVTYCRTVAERIRFDAIKQAAKVSQRLVPITDGRHAVSATQEVKLIEQERARTVLELIEALEPVSREIVLKFYFEHQKTAQICKEMDLTPNQFRDRKLRAVERLKEGYRQRIEGELLAA